MQPTGRAYAFFNSSAPKGDIEAELPYLRREAESPRELELYLFEGVDNVPAEENPYLMPLVQQTEGLDRRYILEARYPGADNARAAYELDIILNQAYQSPLFSPETKEPYMGNILYFEEDGNPVFSR